LKLQLLYVEYTKMKELALLYKSAAAILQIVLI